jgi:hypothetical protein
LELPFGWPLERRTQRQQLADSVEKLEAAADLMRSGYEGRRCFHSFGLWCPVCTLIG